MTTTVHSTLTGADLHESKGVATALSGEVYVADGAGSGVWTPASSVVTNTAFTTGDLKITHKVSADTSWIMWSDGTIGDGSSGASLRANADTAALFALYWNNYSNTLCPVITGRGVSAVADYAAHKKLTLPVGLGRSLALAGTGAGLTAHTVGSTVTTSETTTLIAANLPAYTPSGTISIPAGTFVFGSITTVSAGSSANPGVVTVVTPGGLGVQSLAGGFTTFTGNAQGGSSTPFSNRPATSFVNVMIKL